MTTKRPKPETKPAARARKAGHPPQEPPAATPARMDRATVRAMPEAEKDRMRAEALALRAKGRAASGDNTMLLSHADADRLADLIRCGMLPGDPPEPPPITPKRDAELRKLARARNEANHPNPEARRLVVKVAKGAAGARTARRLQKLLERPGIAGQTLPLFLNSAAEAERVRAHQAEATAAAIAGAVAEERKKEAAGGRAGGKTSGAGRIARRGDCIEAHRGRWEELRKPRRDGTRLSERSAAKRLARETDFHFDAIARHFRTHPTA